jgi:multiple antibiotic resistance protein
VEIAFEDSIKFAVTLISILNPIGALPIFLNLTRDRSASEIKIVSNSCTIAVMVTISLALAFGQRILGFFGISIPSFTIGGGILIFTMAFSMIRARGNEAKINKDEIDSLGDPKEVGIVPLAIPLLSGPGTISSSIIYAKEINDPYHWVGALFVVLLCGLIVKLVLTYARNIGNKIGPIGMNVMSRIMGIILLASSIEMIVAGIKEILPILKGHI